jgi:hypothetical protein
MHCVGNIAVFLQLQWVVGYLLRAFDKLQKRLPASSCLYIRPSAWKSTAPTEGISIEFDI